MPASFKGLADGISNRACCSVQDTVQWLRMLVRAGKHAPVMALDSSARARLGPGVEQLIRCVQRVMDFAKPPENSSGNIYKSDSWTTIACATEGVAALFDLASFHADKNSEGTAGLEEAMKGMAEKAAASIIRVSAAVAAGKESMMAVYTDVKMVHDFMKDQDVATLTNDILPSEMVLLVEKHNTQVQPLQDTIAGAMSLSV